MGKVSLPRFLSDEFHVSGEVTAVFGARIARCAFTPGSARMLPALADFVPMEAKFGQGHRHFARLLLGEGDPNPFANDFGHVPKAWCFAAQEFQQSLNE
jgi:hypothetical protein